MTSRRRCAIYTRKSSEEGLEQDFNSLHAQREACEAFITSQRHEGWASLRERYDDGGFSGGSMERPALRRLLADIGAGKIDVVAVYKVDRLTRSLADFAKIVELFDAKGVSSVSVTQQFNTTTSMGRLTLNVLLSFAQFEREVTGERIRDKIAASKRKGLWMGGVVPLGYDVKDRKLVVNEAEAATVRYIYSTYLALGCVRRLKQDLDARGFRSRVRVAPDGTRSGGQPFSRGALYALLANPIYAGEVRHKGVCHPGQHNPIIDRALWAAVQQRLAQNTIGRAPRAGTSATSPLAGKLFDENSERLTPSHAVKGGRRYRYYVSQALIAGTSNEAGRGWRLPAPEIERAVMAAVSRILDDRNAIAEALGAAGLPTHALPAALAKLDTLKRQLASDAESSDALMDLIERVELQLDSVRLTLTLATLLPDRATPGAARPTITQTFPMALKRRGIEMRLVIEGAAAIPTKADPALLKAIARARGWLDDLLAGRVTSPAEIAARIGNTKRYVNRLLPLAFLAPKIIEAIVEGRQPADLTAEALTTRLDLPMGWIAQKRLLGFS
ncbi:MAG TPA: recombinase family protein [Alphaproteobacteria bacterium]|nr:recombinase family protein [Alphaproteobacteria bacterium]